jgi:isopentenyl-diphosphate delta-isomerase
MEDKVILVDANDQEIGSAEKSKAHREGALHRAFSIFVFNADGKLLLQKRTIRKYHSGGLWSNTCCSHPRLHEPLVEAAHRRLGEEMGINCELGEIFSFTYKVQFADDLFEHEYDHVLVGQYEGEPTPSPEEVDDWMWIDLKGLREDIQQHPDRYTYWLRLCIDRVISHQQRPVSSHPVASGESGVLRVES